MRFGGGHLAFPAGRGRNTFGGSIRVTSVGKLLAYVCLG
jgi:hypothetical protein